MKWKEHNKFQLFPRTLKKFGKFMLKCHKKEQKLEFFVRWHVFKVASSKQQFFQHAQNFYISIWSINGVLHVTWYFELKILLPTDRHINAGMCLDMIRYQFYFGKSG